MATRADLATAYTACRAAGDEDSTPSSARSAYAAGSPHSSNTLAAQTYVSTKDLIARMGQYSPRAALIYQHASRQVDQTIADKLSALIEGIGSRSKTRMTAKRVASLTFWYLLANSTQTALPQY